MNQQMVAVPIKKSIKSARKACILLIRGSVSRTGGYINRTYDKEEFVETARKLGIEWKLDDVISVEEAGEW